MTPIENAFAGLGIGLNPRRHQSLTLYPIFAQEHELLPVISLKQAMARQVFAVSEISAQGSVPQLRVVNDGDHAVFVLAGQELVGAKQNRVTSVSVLVAPQSELIIPVSCVESGRWHDESPTFEYRDRTLFSRARAKAHRDVAESLQFHNEIRADQEEVWREVDRKHAELGVQRRTSSISDVYDHYSESLDDFVEALEPQPGQRGAVFEIDGRIAGMELFGCTNLASDCLPAIIRGYALDAMAERRPEWRPEQHPERGAPQLERACRFLDAVERSECLDSPGVGLGSNLRLRRSGIVGGGLVHDDVLLHLAAFRAPEDDPRHSPEDERLRSGRRSHIYR